ncbi:MAG: hypothetical protein VXX85_02630 [Candidatus Margulisiibacteriota bacterium]|nr:hypothetical protein [Candidatus Margulisiibacteriota bacterium]
MNNIKINASKNTQRITKGYLTRKTIKQNSEIQPVSFSNLPDSTLIKICSLIDLNARLSLTETSKQFSPLGTGPIQTQSLSTAALQKLATDEATKWINGQLQSEYQNPIELIKKINNKEVVIPDYLSVRITRNILINQAIEFANKISDTNLTYCALSDIIKSLLASGNIDLSIELAKTLPRDQLKSFTLKDISWALLDNGNIDHAINLAKTIPDDECKSCILEHIIMTLLENNNVKQAIELVNTIPDKSLKSFGLRNISKYYLKREDVEQAIDFANRIPDDKLKFCVLRYINKHVKRSLNQIAVSRSIDDQRNCGV